MDKFKVGDILKVVRSPGKISHCYSVGTVVRVIGPKREDGCYIDRKGYDVCDELTPLQQCVHEEDLQLVRQSTDEIIKMKPQNLTLQMPSIGHDAEFNESGINIGCRTLSLKDAKRFVDKFNELYEVLDQGDLNGN